MKDGASWTRGALGLAAVALLVSAGCDDSKQGPPGPAGPAGPTGPQGSPGGGASGRTLSFIPIEAPTTDAAKRGVLSSPGALVNDDEVALSYHTELRSGQTLGTNTFGLVVDQNMAPVQNADHSNFISPANDFSSLLKVGAKLFEVTHFETTPAAMYLSELTQAADGTLTATSTKPIDFKDVRGLWTPCAGSVTPWNTHLGSEEYPADARQWETAATLGQVGAGNMIRYFGLDPATATVAEAKAVFNPYNYGFPVEVTVAEAGTATVKKHYAAGRRALELAYVMPDQKTVYLTDDGTNDGFYMFIATTAGDLSSGRLFAARWFQTSPAGQGHGAADIYWIELKSNATDSTATDAQVRAEIDTGVKFSDIFETETPAANGTCPSAASGFKSIAVDVTYTVATECLKLKPGKELAASRLETRRYAAYLGATTEFRKNEGITFDPAGSRLYVAFSELNNGTTDNHPTRDLGGPNHIRLAENPCGAVYEYVIAPSTALGSNYVAQSASALLEGVWLANPASPNPYPPDSPYAGKNTCSVSAISNPDNISFVPGYETLIIGEDSGVEHQNDAVWAYNIVTRELTRILTTPYGAESTGVYFYGNLNGHAYIKTQVQHPYGESDSDKADPSPAAPERQSYTGYIGPFPAMN